MIIKKISSQFHVSEQISVADVEIASAQGIKTIICNRPENETPDQPQTSDIAAAAASLGIDFLHIPVVSGAITDTDVSDFGDAYRNSEGPILAYCRSGMRSAALWALAEAQSLDCDEILAATRNAGYDLSGLRPRLLKRAREHT